jgi:hypothetical protein
MTRAIALCALLAASAGCTTYVTPRYSISADTNVALKSVAAPGISVGAFAGPAEFDRTCRAAGPLAPPDGMTHAAYIKKALEDELKVAGLYAATSPRVTLTGTLNTLAFSSSRGMTGGSWDIDVTVTSSNGKAMSLSEHYEFESGFVADTACKQTAEAFMPAVQNLVGKLVRAPRFRELVQ